MSTAFSPDISVSIIIFHLAFACIYLWYLLILDGFLSSLGCASKEKIGRLLRGRDCENHLVENKFERFCYCRYHGCNHKSIYYSGAQGVYGGNTLMMAVILFSVLGLLYE